MAKQRGTSNLPILLTIFILLTTLFPAEATGSTTSSGGTSTDFIRTSCGATTYPSVCYASLSVYADKVKQSPSQLARVAVSVSLAKARSASAYVARLRHGSAAAAEPRALAALTDCVEMFGDAVDQMTRSLAELQQLQAATFRWQMSNVETWMSAALTNEDSCLDGFQGVSSSFKTVLGSRVSNVKQVTSNALALVNSLASKVSGN